jgi:nitroreductase
MDVERAIRERYTADSFRADPVPLGLITELLELAVWAPNHKRTEPWRFVVLHGTAAARYAAARAEMAAEAALAKDEDRDKVWAKTHAKFARIPAYVAVVMRASDDRHRYEEDYAATAALIQNFLLAAHGRGLGTMWKTYKDSPALRDLLGLRDDEVVVGMIHLGYPDDAPGTRTRTPARERLTVLE